MPHFAHRRRVCYSPDEMFALVADIERYPQFLPWCTHLKIRERREEGDKTILIADMTIAFAVVSERFGSKVTLVPAERRINVEYVDGPFRYLHNRWHFEPGPTDQGSLVDFDIDFEFKSRPLSILIGAVFQRTVLRLVHAFEVRAEALYGRRAAAS